LEDYFARLVASVYNCLSQSVQELRRGVPQTCCVVSLLVGSDRVQRFWVCLARHGESGLRWARSCSWCVCALWLLDCAVPYPGSGRSGFP
jgi:hypothetical protein